MFYCDPCREKNDWPQSMMKSEGPCEVCGVVRICFDMPSRLLPLPKKNKKDGTPNG